MTKMKDWIRTKCNDASLIMLRTEPSPPPAKTQQNGSRSKAPVAPLPSISSRRHTNVVTPDTIPVFTIPRCDKSPTVSTDNLMSDSNESLATNASQSSPRLCVRQGSRSEPVSPHSYHQYSDIDASFQDDASPPTLPTNVDPYSLTALSLPHLKTVTNYGFDTLAASPNTRRKESLFHDSDSSGGSSPLSFVRHRQRIHSADAICRSPTQILDEVELYSQQTRSRSPSDTCVPPRQSSSKRRNVPSLVVPLGVMMPQQRLSVGENPFLQPPSPSYPSGNSPTKNYSRTLTWHAGAKPRRPNFRRSSSSEITELLNSRVQRPLDSNDDSAENEGLPNYNCQVTRRRRSCNPIISTEGDISRAISPPRGSGKRTNCSSRSVNPLSHSYSTTAAFPSKHVPTADDAQDNGTVSIFLEYEAQNEQLRVELLRAINLGGGANSDINPFFKLSLLPGKQQKQSSTVCKHNCDPVFNQDFHFRFLSLEQLKSMSLRIKVYHKTPNLRRANAIGQIAVPLRSLDLEQGVHLWENVEPINTEQSLGRLHVSLCFQPGIEKLQVTLTEADELPRRYLTGPPDPYVKLELSQPGRPTIKYQTRIRKKTQTPLFQDDFSFNISPKIGDLDFTTLTMTLYDHETIRSDEVIGQVRFGFGATEESEFDHWNNVLQNPEKIYTDWHKLMEVE